MKLRPLLVSALLLAALFPAGAVAAAPTGGGDLFVLQASFGEIEGNRLVLEGVESEVTSFTDRPQRSAGSLSATRFLAGWGKTFGSVPPNAALEVADAPAGRDVALLELRDPHYDKRSDTLTYSIRRLRKTGDTALVEFDRRGDGNRVTSFGHASLFIDSGEPEPLLAVARFFVPAGAKTTLTFEGEPSLGGPGATDITGVGTPTSGAGSSATSAGAVDISGNALTLEAPAGGGGFEAQMVLSLSGDGAGKVNGSASIPTGGSVEFSFGGNQFVKLPGGNFSVGE